MRFWQAPRLHTHTSTLLCLLALILIAYWGAVHPQRAESQPTGDGGADSGNPRPCAADDEAARPLVVGHVANRNSVLLLDVAQQGSLVVDLEVEDTVLIGQLERRSICCLIGGRLLSIQRERQAVEGREHGELELKSIVLGDGECVPGGP